MMKDGTFNPTLLSIKAAVCRSIRAGWVDRLSCLKILKTVDKRMYEAYKASTIRATVDFNLVNEWLTEVHLKYLRGEYEEIIS